MFIVHLKYLLFTCYSYKDFSSKITFRKCWTKVLLCTLVWLLSLSLPLVSNSQHFLSWSSPAGRLGGAFGMQRGEWQMVPGWHCELGRGLRPPEQARGLHARYQAAGLDPGGKWGVDWAYPAGKLGQFQKIHM